MDHWSAAFTFTEDEARVLALALTTFASLLAEADTDVERRERKTRIVRLKLELLAQCGLSITDSPSSSGLREALAAHVADWEEPKRNALLVDIAFAQPFAPYEVRVSTKEHAEQLTLFCPSIGLMPERAKQVLESIDAARRSHRHIEWGKIAAGAVLGAVVVAAGGYAAAPLLAAHLGAAAGLGGAAAVAHGLALLGGGALAAGGSGVAGGMALVTAVGVGVGSVSAGGAAALWSAGYAAAVGELIKLQVSYREVLLRGQLRNFQVAEIVEKLVSQRKALEVKLADERALNDRTAGRLKELERIVQGYDDTIKWLGQQPQADC